MSDAKRARSQSEVMSLRLGKDVRDTLRSQAELRGISDSQLAREALEAWLKTESLGVAPDLEDGVQALTRPPSISELEAALQEAHHTRHEIVRSAGLAQSRLNKFEKMLADREQRLAEALADRDRTLLQRDEAEKAAQRATAEVDLIDYRVKSLSVQLQHAGGSAAHPRRRDAAETTRKESD